MTMQTSATLALNEAVRARWARGETVYHLGFGESRFPVHPALLEELRRHAGRKEYPPVQGLPALREAIAGYYRRALGLEVDPGQVVVGPGSKILLWAMLQALPGDLILPRPSWVSYAPQARLTGKAVAWAAADPARDYVPTGAQLAAAAEELRARGASPGVVIFNTPNNPTGVVYPEAAVAELAAAAREQGLALISDELYCFVGHGRRPHASFAAADPERAVITGGLSKHLSLGGWRLGFAILPRGPWGEDLRRRVVAIASETWSGAALPVQHAAALAYSDHPELGAYIARCSGVHAAMVGYLRQALLDLGVESPSPDGGFYLYPSFERWRAPLAAAGVRTSEDLVRFLLEEARIAALPGTAFGSPPEELVIRVATSYVDADTDERAQALLDAFDPAQDPRAFVERNCPNLLAACAALGRLADRLGAPGKE